MHAGIGRQTAAQRRTHRKPGALAGGGEEHEERERDEKSRLRRLRAQEVDDVVDERDGQDDADGEPDP